MTNKATLTIEYYQRPFHLLYSYLEKEGFQPKSIPNVRSRFWKLLPYRTYTPFQIYPILKSYIVAIEKEINRCVSKYSIAYWIHLYRRIAPITVWTENKPITANAIRDIMEAAFQKYAKKEFCSSIAQTDDIEIEEVLSGLLMLDEFQLERHILENSNQLVLTDFSQNNLKELSNLELLCYEIWRTNAMMRIVGKGASVIVDGDIDQMIYDLRSDELDNLVKRYDVRLGEYGFVGGALGIPIDGEKSPYGNILIPKYNVSQKKVKDSKQIFKLFGMSYPDDLIFNFSWYLFNLLEFRIAHLPFSDAFLKKYKVSLNSVLGLLSILQFRVFLLTIDHPEYSMTRYWQRAYDGPHSLELLIPNLEIYKAEALSLLGLTKEEIDNVNLEDAIKFWTQNSKHLPEIDLSYSGPHGIFLPVHNNKNSSELIIINYAHIHRRLHDLFLGLQISDQTFKGDILENYLLKDIKLALPNYQLKSFDGSSKQIDASVELDEKKLLIIECKSISHSIGFLKGQKSAIDFRIRKISEALDQVETKANWLKKNPVGKNYNAQKYETILSVVITPFVEYMPSLSKKYWLTDDIPKVLTPKELLNHLDNNNLIF